MLAEIRLIHVSEYHQMAEAGILDPDERVELIDGQIFKMAAKGTAHSATTSRTEKLFERLLSERAWVRVQEPIRLNDYSEPEPDVAIVQPDPLDYADHHPTVSEVYIVIEVADTTLRRDCQFKANVYAKAGIADYWVVDVTARQLYVFRSPQPEGYQHQFVLLDDGTIAPLHFPEVTIAVADLLPKVSS
jgi:Uma2 family endonuclease